MTEPILVMDHLVTITYREDLPPNLVRFAEQLLDGKIVGQRCPQCQRVYVPGKGYCPMCVVAMGPEHELEVSDRGVVTGFTVVAPVRYYGQTKTEPFVYASVLLDGSSGALTGQDITGLPIEEVRAGLRVKAVWKPAEERTTEGQSPRGWGSVVGVISSFEPSGEPDVDRQHYQEHAV